MRYGHFDDANCEYVVEKPNTPLPWINYLGTQKYCALISNTAGGYSFYEDPRERRILRYRYDNVPFDQGGRYLYIRNNKNKDIYSPTWQPVQKKLEKYECRHGLGYTSIASLYKGIKTKITYFVPMDENLEIWKVEIENKTKKNQDLTLFSFVEFCLWDAVGDSTNFQRTWSIGKAYCDGSTIIHDTLHKSWVDILAFFGASEKIDSFDCQRKNFLGNNGYNSLQKPKAVVDGRCSNSEAIGWAPVGSHCIKLKLASNQKKTMIFVLGVAPDEKKAKELVKKFTKVQTVDLELTAIKEYWKKNLSKIQVKTPDENVNSMLNIWNQYQCMQTFNWSRYASYYESGIGRGMGFRDSNQDTLGFVHIIPDKVKKRILDLASIQFEEGDTYHQYSPITGKGALYGYSDDHLWLIVSVSNYIKATGDWKILDEEIPFAEKEEMIPLQMGHHDHVDIQLKDEKHKKVKKATLYEHLKRAILFSWKNIGPHGFPKAGFADWNDCLNMVGKNGMAESVFVAELLVFAAREMISIASHKGLKKDKDFFENSLSEMASLVNEYAWDGEWYLRAFDDEGKPVGASTDKAAKIFLETQPWAVISGAASKDRAKICMDSVANHLETEKGIKLLHPSFKEYKPKLGEISTYPPGLKENGSVFCHTNPWVVIAECLLGHGDKAFKYYSATLPSAQNNVADVRKTEPYVYCQMIAGPDHPDFGEGKNSWLTGAASWSFVAAIQWIIGVRPDYNGLIVDPCLPKKWKEVELNITVRGVKYNIKIRNSFKVSKGVKFLKVDGQRADGCLIPYFKDGKEHKVEAILA
ncbi:hypothetical protein A2230_07460 [candidate division WOR-1 bacterium RIFOXYA2_FULL_36_21]|uniref:Uncharacterized protein n=1 Tax=candidate division WOR-1 bacterium RIFOXYB2_FULL_36_35 TaxID=1802578 RepID=A0A1F4S2V3_UNCSA|nr:MAG: hypothetical protein A2230_07460 [candidate division WOR-1 bacterium RIFOXYA2_FULL_36_21]OGC14775.1 MAG: hypothetical protein A2290_08785 [candidate division WOR-1 bacterium RIFOXYB2_FULL_36_35]OGC16956.1 MAG: hypothetical protein A2282_08650 [candidate division WOR-1 bacterium RIFOXYA12_FULL_36_13]